MKNIILVVILVAISACSPCRHLTTSTKDSVRVEVRTRTEYIRDTAWIKVPVEFVRQTVLVDSSHLETSFSVSEARINPDGSLSHSLANKPQDKPAPFDRSIEYRDSIVYRDRAVKEVVSVERELSWWQKTQIRGFWVLLVVVAFMFRKNIVSLARRMI